jgi:hypothetical protein
LGVALRRLVFRRRPVRPSQSIAIEATPAPQIEDALGRTSGERSRDQAPVKGGAGRQEIAALPNRRNRSAAHIIIIILPTRN